MSFKLKPPLSHDSLVSLLGVRYPQLLEGGNLTLIHIAVIVLLVAYRLFQFRLI